MPDIIDTIASHAERNGYHPRSSAQSDLQSRHIVADLLDHCAKLRQRAAVGDIVVKYTHHQQVGHEDWKIDIALGTPATRVPPSFGKISEAAPVLIQIAIELKSVWTEHNKAKRNRLRDFSAFHGHAHRYNPRIVAGAFLFVNASDYFFSPLNADRPDPITKHGPVGVGGKLAAKSTVDLFRSIHLRNSEIDVPGLEGLGIVVVDHDNINFAPASIQMSTPHFAARAVRTTPAPQMGDPLNYETFLQRLCIQYSARY